DHAASVIDIGAGASTLVDGLVAAGYRNLTVLDLSPMALAIAQQRLGSGSAAVSWRTADVFAAVFPAASFDVWHDRAVFHFLTDPADRTAYTAAAARAVSPGGVAVVGCFALDGPTHCSGLRIVQYSPEKLASQFSPIFELERAEHEVHTTPSGLEQPFTWVVMRRRSQV
ncbi:MAG: class I SAM-dependent methyltransferase, partial [Acidimicrobiales bacterium]